MINCETVQTSESEVAELLEMMTEYNALEVIPWQRQSVRPVLERLLRSKDLGVVCRLLEDGSMVGYFVLTWGFDLEWAGRDAFLTELFLTQTARGRGLGREAMRWIEATAKEHGARALHLMVRHENIPALRLYLGSGFQEPPRKFLSKSLVEPF
jgi:GNAT superfamily N-acetyltransferase